MRAVRARVCVCAVVCVCFCGCGFVSEDLPRPSISHQARSRHCARALSPLTSRPHEIHLSRAVVAVLLGVCGAWPLQPSHGVVFVCRAVLRFHVMSVRAGSDIVLERLGETLDTKLEDKETNS